MSTAQTTAALTPSSNTKRLATVKSGAGQAGPSKPATSPVAPRNAGAGATATAGVPGGKDVVSPGELCGFVDSLLSQLETRFDEMSEQMIDRMNEMSSRIDNLENTIQDLMHGGVDSSDVAPLKGKI